MMVFSSYLMQALQEQLIGQEYAVTALTRVVTLALSGLRHDSRPLAVLLFMGPTGSGKTHAAQSLSRVLLGDERRMIYVNCQQFGQVADLLANLQRQLLVRNWQLHMSPPPLPSPFSIIVFEGIDKAPAAFRDHLATSIDRGEMFLSSDFCSLRQAVIILTVNLSKKKTDQLIGRTIGFFREDEAGLGVPRQHILALEEVDNLLGGHLVSRIDEITIFERLNELNIMALLERQLAEIERLLAGLSVGFMIDPDAKSFLLRHGLEDLTHGRRQIHRAVRNYLEVPLADLFLSRRLAPGTTVLVKYESPRNFLNLQILIPRLQPLPQPFVQPPALRAEALV
jgi:ATP-dependent Clp protease ATP-binding subunit ClpA